MSDQQPLVKQVRSLEDIAIDVLQCAMSWEPAACLMGNVRADEIVRLVASRMITCPFCGAEAWVNIDCPLCVVISKATEADRD